MDELLGHLEKHPLLMRRVSEKILTGIEKVAPIEQSNKVVIAVDVRTSRLAGFFYSKKYKNELTY